MFGSQLHTHGAGRAVETTLVGRDTAAETLVNRDPHYSTHFQVPRAPGPSTATQLTGVRRRYARWRGRCACCRGTRW